MEDYIVYMSENGSLNNKTINRSVTSVKEVLRYLKLKKLTNDIDFLDHIERLPENDNRYGVLSVDEVLRMAELARTKERNLKEVKYYLILFALDTCLRKQAILNLKWSDFEVREDFVIVNAIDKGNKSFRKQISKEFYEELTTLRKTDDVRVFPISKDAVDEMIPRLRKLMNLSEERGIVFHSIRKAGVTFQYRLTNDLLQAQKAAGHSNISTTMLYIQEEDYSLTGAISSKNVDETLFEKVTHEELITALKDMNRKDILHLLNIKLQEKIK
jgi:integrase